VQVFRDTGHGVMTPSTATEYRATIARFLDAALSDR
jgi:hypothetical protein